MLTDTLYRLLRPLPVIQRQYTRIVRRLPHRRRTVSHFNRRLVVDPSELHGFYLYYEQEYDDPIFRYLDAQLSRSTRALDLGANIGIYTTFLAKHCQFVDAFEPEQRVLPRLKENLRINGLENVSIHEQCVADSTGIVSFNSPTQVNEGVGQIGEEGQPVPSVALDDFLSGVDPVPLFIKMDIEGGEWLAIQGMSQTVKRWTAPLAMLIELHPEIVERLGGTMPALREMLEGMGLRVFSFDAGQLKPVVETARFWWATNSSE